jgi:uncharacterized protein with PIN domain
LSVRLYMDVHVPRAITEGLRLRGIDVLTAQEDDASALTDPELLDRAAAHGRVLFTRDADLLVEATQRQRANRSFAGLVYAHQLHVTIGQCVHDLELIAAIGNLTDLAGRVEYLPLR